MLNNKDVVFIHQTAFIQKKHLLGMNVCLVHCKMLRTQRQLSASRSSQWSLGVRQLG